MSNLTKWDPFAELTALQKQFFGDDWFTPSRSTTIPTTDVYTNDNKELVIEAHLPNFKEEDVHAHLDNGALIIQAESHEKEEDRKKKYVVRESSTSFYRRIQLPERAVQDKIEAHMDNGVLKVTIPFTEQPEPKKITIKSKQNK